jgi:dGTPase
MTVWGVDEDVVETACLAHDLGHPPFGHIAENRLDHCVTTEGISDGFEGNPQSFRVVTRLAIRNNKHLGLNLTRASLNAILKYPWVRAHNTDSANYKKWGHYDAEREDFSHARALEKPGDQRKSAEAAIMDWADDVAYSLHDVDDFYRAGFVPLGQIVTESAESARFLAAMHRDAVIDDETKGAEFLKKLREYFIDSEILVPFQGKTTQYQALNKLEALLIRRYLGLDQPGAVALKADHGPRLVIEPTLRREVDLLKGLMRFYVYGDPALVAQQYGQREVVGKLFEILFGAVQPASPHTLIIPPPFDEEARSINAAHGAGSGKTERVRLVTDIIASMTEQQAIGFHQRLCGIAPGSILDRIVKS